jgi:type II secretory pathway pseudopilin PulG
MEGRGVNAGSEKEGAAGGGGARGHTLVEIVVALAILTVTGGGVLLCYLGGQGLGRTNRETDLAFHAALSAIDNVRSVPFEEAFARFNQDPADDLPGDSPGSLFDVAGLTPPEGADACGRIEFPGDGLTLSEDVEDEPLGMPRDLNADGLTDANDHADDYVVLPLRVRINWTGSGGERSVDVVTLLAREKQP